MPDRPARLLQYGLGPIGRATARCVLDAEPCALELVGGVDVDPELVGRDLGELVGRDRLGLPVRARPGELLERAQVVLHTTTSSLEEVADQILACARAGCHVVSSTEELLFPFERHPELSRTIDRVAREHGVAVLGTGVNPGFVMDTLALTATGVCTGVEQIEVRRVVDATERRRPLQEKIGAGRSEAEFRDLREKGGVGHVGLVESLRLLAHGLDWSLTRVEESLEPILAERPVQTPYVRVDPGRVAGIDHRAAGYVDEESSPRIRLRLQMYLGAPEPRDVIRIAGDPPVNLRIGGGIFGDTATVGALVNAVPTVREAAPGLRTTAELPLPRASGPPLARTASSPPGE